MRDWPATAAVTAATMLVSLLLIVSSWLSVGAVEAGFIPARIGAVIPAHDFLVPAWATPLTATLVHAGLAHLLLNLVMLVYCGQLVERALGARGMLLLYGLGAYAAAAAQWAFEPDSPVPMIGASGAISAVVAVYALLYGERRAKAIGPVPAGAVHAAWLAAAWIGIQLLIGLAGIGGLTIAIGAHIGGFVAGLALARPLLLWRYRNA